jgi:hypothetical protein
MCCISTSVGSLSYDNHSFLSYVHMSMPSSLSMPVTTSWLEPSSTCSISSSVGVSYVGQTSRSYDVDKGFSRNIVPSSTTSMTEPDLPSSSSPVFHKASIFTVPSLDWIGGHRKVKRNVT